MVQWKYGCGEDRLRNRINMKSWSRDVEDCYGWGLEDVFCSF